MFSLRLVTICALCLVSLANGQYGAPKKDAYAPPPKDDKGYEKKEDVLFVKGKPVEDGKIEEPLDDQYGAPKGYDDKKIKEVKAEETGYDSGAYGKEVKDVKYDEKDKFGPVEGDKFGDDKAYGGGEYGGDKAEKKYDSGKESYGEEKYGAAPKKEYKKAESYDAVPPKGEEGKAEQVEEIPLNPEGAGDEHVHGFVGGYLPESPKGGYGPVPVNPKESYGGWAPKRKSGGEYGKGGEYGGEGDKYGKEIEPKGPKGGYGGGEYGKGAEGGYGGIEPQGPKGGYGGAPKGGYGEEKFEETVKEGGYGKGPKGDYGKPKDLGGEEKYEVVKEGGGAYGGVPKGGYGGEEKKVFEEKEIRNGGGFGGGGEYGGGKPFEGGYEDDKKALGGGGYGPKPDVSVTTISTKACNKLVDGLLDKLQTSFTGHMNTYKVDRISPVKIGGWGRVRLSEGKFDKIGKLCRGGDFQVLPQGENIIIRGTVTVPEPRAKFCGDAYLYNRLKVRNRNLLFCAKDASFRMQMIVNKRNHKVDVDELEPVGVHGFHVEDEQGAREDGLAWPFNKIRPYQIDKQKYQFMSTLQHKLCDDFRKIIQKPEVKEEILQLV